MSRITFIGVLRVYNRESAVLKSSDLNNKLSEYSETVWRKLIQEVVAIKRRQFRLSYSELDLV